MAPQFDVEHEAEALRQQLKKLLTAWAERAAQDLASAEWHSHDDVQEDVLIIESGHEVVFQILIRRMRFSADERRRRRAEALKRSVAQSNQ